jgi:lysylphosphatidylglycerol synthetase-like protein (DUF2156 family)
MALEAYTEITRKAFDETQVKEFAEEVCAAGRDKGKAIVVFGHSSTVAALMKDIGLEPLTPDVGDRDVVDTASWSMEQRRYADCGEGCSQFEMVTNHE